MIRISKTGYYDVVLMKAFKKGMLILILVCNMVLALSLVVKEEELSHTYKDLNLTYEENKVIKQHQDSVVSVGVVNFYDYKKYEELIKSVFQNFFNIRLNIIEYENYNDAYNDIKKGKIKYIITNYRHDNDLIRSDVIYSGNFYVAYKPSEGKEYKYENTDYSFFRNKTTYIRKGYPLIYPIKSDNQKSKVIEYEDINKVLEEIKTSNDNSVLLINEHMLKKVYENGLVTNSILNKYKSPIMLLETTNENSVFLNLINQYFKLYGQEYISENINENLINISKDVFRDNILDKNEKEWLKNNKNIKVKVYNESYPILFWDEGEIKGLSKDYLEGLSRLTGLNITYEKVGDSPKNIDTPEENEIYIGNSVGDTEGAFEYRISSDIFVVGKGSEIIRLEEYAGKIGVIKNGFVDNYFKGIGKSNVIRYDTVKELLNEYDEGRIPFMCLGEYDYYNEVVNGQHDMNVVNKLDVKAESNLFCFSKNGGLYSIFNKAIDRIINNGLIDSSWKYKVSDVINKSVYEYNAEVRNSTVVKSIGICLIIAISVVAIIFRVQNSKLIKNNLLVELIENNSDNAFFIYDREVQRFRYISNNIGNILIGIIKEDVINNRFAPIDYFDSEYSDVLMNSLDVSNIKNGLNIVVTSSKVGNKKLFYEIDFQLSRDGKYGKDELVCIKIKNITKEYEYNRKIKKAFQRAKAANKAKGKFLASMSHEIRTPINAIMGTSTVGIKYAQGEKEKERFERILIASEYLLSLVNDILDMSKIESGRLELEIGEVDFNKLVNEIKFIITERINQKNQKLIIKLDKSLSGCYIGDYRRLVQVILNLLSNANKFTPDDKDIVLNINEVLSEEGKSTIKVSVIDKGIGVPKNLIENLFEPFFQIHNDLHINQIGTGLGLPISKNIVELMGGSLYVESQENKGSVFSFTITLSKKELNQKTDLTKEEHQLEKDISGMKILLVDDVEINRIIVQEMLSDKKIEVYSAENGKEAVDMFLDSDIGYFDVIIMDIQMPVMNGNEAIRKIRASKREDSGKVTIIAMSANAFEEDVKASEKAGTNYYITKPVKIKSLLEVLYEV